MARYLVTGGAGFIGSNLARALLERGESVRVLDDFSTGDPRNLEGCDGDVHVERGSITDAPLVARVTRDCDYVLHHAAMASVPASLDDPLACDRINAHGTLVVLQAARDAGVKRLVYASSSAVYGDSPALPKHERLTPAPLSPYAATKLAGEHHALVYARCFGLETVALRYFNVFGRRQSPRSQYAAVIPRFVTMALAGQTPTIYGDGLQTRDFCHVDNVIAANLRACVAEGASGQAFNVACGVSTTLLGVLETLAAITGAAIAPRFEPARAGDIRDSHADISAARATLGYDAAVPFAEGLRRAVAWYREHASP